MSGGLPFPGCASISCLLLRRLRPASGGQLETEIRMAEWMKK
jgi:hypothetical protein